MCGRRIVKITSIILFSFLTTTYAQSIADPCLNYAGCQNGGGVAIAHNLPTANVLTMEVQQIFFAALTSNLKLDTSYSGTIDIKLISGPAALSGTLSKNFSKYTYVDIMFPKEGAYDIEISLSGIEKDTFTIAAIDIDYTELCKPSGPGCQNGNGDSLWVQAGPNVVVVDVVFPINIYVVNSVTGKIDTSYIGGNFSLKKINGPGNLIGTTSIQGREWTLFSNLSFNQVGNYDIEVSVDNVGKDTISYKAVLNTNAVINIKTQNNYAIYPNPSLGKLNIHFSEIDPINAIKVYNEVGQVVYFAELEGNNTAEIDLSSLNNGVYYFEVNQKNKITVSEIILLK